MIVPMKKVSVLAQEKDRTLTVAELRNMGILHVEHHRTPRSRDIDILKENIELIDKAVAILINEEALPPAGIKPEPEDPKTKAAHIVNIHDRLGRLSEYSRITEREIIKWKPWGNFDPEDINRLKKEGINVELCSLTPKQLKEMPGGITVKKISKTKGAFFCALISKEEINLPFNKLKLPKISVKEMESRLSEDKQTILNLKADLGKEVVYLGPLQEAKKNFLKIMDFEKALNGAGTSGEITYISGYVPENKINDIEQAAKKEKWAVLIKDPSPEDNVPTLIKNPGWVSIIEPIFKMIDIVPGYRELDISFWFLAFFSVFFGMLIGDAAYGAIFFGITFFAQRKFGKKTKDKSIFILFYILSLCAVIWGALSGTFFGQEWLPKGVTPVLPILRDNESVQVFCFFLGALQLSVAHLWRAVIKAPSLSAIAHVGWASILWGAFFLANTLILGHNFPAFAKWLFIIGPILVVLFTSPQKNVLKGIASGTGALLLNFVNSFTDIVSYIRLFAVGIATVAIADAFNSMAMNVGWNSVATGILTAFILFLGHSLNIILGPLAVLVHGVRLNVLEFCNHLDIKWSGFSYKPLKR